MGPKQRELLHPGHQQWQPGRLRELEETMKLHRWGLAIVLLAAEAVVAQWAPVSAKQVTTTDIISGTRVKSHRVVRERYVRASSGAFLIQHLTADGKTPKTATLFDSAKTHNSYLLDYQGASAVDLRRPVKIPPPPPKGNLSPEQKKEIIGEENVHGVHCLISPLYAFDASGNKRMIGRVWAAPDYDFLMVRQDSTQVLADGNVMHIVRELQEISAGTEPDSALFTIDPVSIKKAATITSQSLTNVVKLVR
jgi:hypothetical protein